MIDVLHALGVLVPLVAAIFAMRSASFLAARRVSVAGSLLALVMSVIALVLAATADPSRDPGWSAILPTFVGAIGLTAVAMSPTTRAGSATFARILALNALSTAMVLTTDPLALAALFALSVLIPWLELRAPREDRPPARSFAVYMLPSASLVGVGAAMMALDVPAAAVPIAVGIAIRQALVPVHSWFPRFVERAPMGIVVAFAAPQLGVYAHLRLISGNLPPDLEQIVAIVGAVTVVFAAALGVVQTRARRALAYLMMSETALVAFGLETGASIGFTGALVAWLVSGLATAGLAMTIAALEARRGALSLERSSGRFRRKPLLATAYLVLGLASVGLPGTLGFIAEDLLVQGSVARYPLLGFTLIVGTALNGVTILRSYFALFTGTRRHGGDRDLTLRERAALTLVLAILVFAGIWPAGPVRWIEASAAGTVAATQP